MEIAKTPHHLQSWIGLEIVYKDLEIITKEQSQVKSKKTDSTKKHIR
jgi:hypothetical protein